MNNEQR